jgi:hypothetical protein
MVAEKPNMAPPQMAERNLLSVTDGKNAKRSMRNDSTTVDISADKVYFAPWTKYDHINIGTDNTSTTVPTLIIGRKWFITSPSPLNPPEAMLLLAKKISNAIA